MRYDLSNNWNEANQRGLGSRKGARYLSTRHSQ